MSLRDIKNSVIKELDWKLKNEILEKTNYDLLVKLIDRAEDEKEVSAVFQLGTQYYKTGLKYDVRLEKTSPDIHYLKKNEEKSFETDPNSLTHKLIIGDNYYALLNLLISYRGLIDVIYIDPPYGCDSMGQFADTNYENNITRDNLLSMLHTRLILAKQLLSETGVIFCSIDDRNQAYVKCLFDNVFGEENFIANFCKKGTGGKQDSKTYSAIHEYVLVYAKNISDFTPARQEKELVGYTESDSQGRLYKTQLLRKWGDNSRKEDRPNLFYPIYYSEIDNSFCIEKKDENDIEIFPITAEGEGRWRWEKKTMEKAFNENRVEIKKDNGKYIPYERLFKEEAENLKPFTTWLDNIANNGTQILKDIFNNKVFDYPKSVELIKFLLCLINSRDSVVLDFFAGSGTTGQAVLDLNREDGGKRKFILCTNNDTDDVNINGIAYDVTCERLKRVMTGCDYKGNSDFKWAEKNEPYGDNLLVCECETINNFSQTPGDNAFEKIDETLYDQNKMNDPDKIKWVCENFNLTCKYIEGEE